MNYSQFTLDVKELLGIAQEMGIIPTLDPLDDPERIILSSLDSYSRDAFMYIVTWSYNLAHSWTSRPFSLFQYEALREYLRREEKASSSIKEERRRINAEQFKPGTNDPSNG